MQFSNYPVIILVALAVAMLAILITIGTLAVIYLHRVYIRMRQKKQQEAEDAILDELNEHVLSYDSVKDIPEKELNAMLRKLDSLKNHSLIYRNTLVRILVGFRLNFSGKIARIVNATFTRLKLREFTLGKLKSAVWFLRVQGLKEVQEMHDGHSIRLVMALANDRNVDVRVSAYSALLQLNQKNPFGFMEQECEELTRWHQLFLLDAVQKANLKVVPDFKSYLGSGNDSLVLLSLKLIAQYNQLNALPKLMALLQHANEAIRHEGIGVLGQLGDEEAALRLIEVYPKETRDNRAHILTALGTIRHPPTFDFIVDQFLSTDDFILLKSAAAAMNGFQAELRAEKLPDTLRLRHEQQLVIRHFEEPLNQYGAA